MIKKKFDKNTGGRGSRRAAAVKRGHEVLVIAIVFCAMLLCVSVFSIEQVQGENSLSPQRLGGSLALPEQTMVDGQYFAIVTDQYYDDEPESIFDSFSVLGVDILFALVPVLSFESVITQFVESLEKEISPIVEFFFPNFFALEMPDVKTPYATHGGVI